MDLKLTEREHRVVYTGLVHAGIDPRRIRRMGLDDPRLEYVDLLLLLKSVLKDVPMTFKPRGGNWSSKGESVK